MKDIKAINFHILLIQEFTVYAQVIYIKKMKRELRDFS